MYVHSDNEDGDGLRGEARREEKRREAKRREDKEEREATVLSCPVLCVAGHFEAETDPRPIIACQDKQY